MPIDQSSSRQPPSNSNAASDGARGSPAPRIAIVVSRYNASITDKLMDGALAVCQQSRIDNSEIIDAPGAFELVALAHAAASSDRFNGVLALGCIIKGETRHDEYLSHAVTQGLANISLVTGVPVSLGVLTVNTIRQARARSGGAKGNKGAEAMQALLITIAQIEQINRGRSAFVLAGKSRGASNFSSLVVDLATASNSDGNSAAASPAASAARPDKVVRAAREKPTDRRRR